MDVKALHKISYGIYVVTSVKDGRYNGQIANSVIQVTADPPTVAVSINKNNLTHEFIQSSRVFAISIVCEAAPLSFIGGFGFKSGRDTDKLAGVNYKIGETGAPIVLKHAVACLEARVVQEMSVGTHTIFVGEVVGAEVLTGDVCMTYEHYHRIKGGTTPKTAPSYLSPETTEAKEEAKPVMAQYRCTVCGYIYDPEKGDPDNNIQPGIAFEDLPDDWECPVCGASKDEFEKID